MSSSPAVTDNSVLVWTEMESLDRAYSDALKKGDVMNALRNVLAILTLLNGVNTTRETEGADRQTRNVELLQQVQAWIEDDGLTAEEIAKRILEMQGEDILARYPSIAELLLEGAPALDGDLALSGYMGIDELTALINTAAASGTGIDPSYFSLDDDQLKKVASDVDQAFRDFLTEIGDFGDASWSSAAEWYQKGQHALQLTVVDILRTDPQARALADAYTAAPSDESFEKYADYLTKSLVEHYDSRKAYSVSTWIQDSKNGAVVGEMLRNAPGIISAWDTYVAERAAELKESSEAPYSDFAGVLVFSELAQSGSGKFTWDYDTIELSDSDFDAALASVRAQVDGALTALFGPVVGGSFDLSNPEDVQTVAAYLATTALAPNLEAQSDVATLNRILIDTIGIDFSGLKDAIENDPDTLADEIQNRIDVDTRVSDNQAISLKQLLQEQQVLLTLMSEIINLNSRMNRLVAQ